MQKYHYSPLTPNSVNLILKSTLGKVKTTLFLSVVMVQIIIINIIIIAKKYNKQSNRK